MAKKLPYVAKQLHDKANLFAERNAVYGDNYLRFGKIMMALLPNGIHLESESDMNQFTLFVQLVHKLSRYANSLGKGGHADSLDDNAVYSMMLKQSDELFNGRKK